MSYRADKQVLTAHTDGRTDGHTDRQTQATTIPEGQNWPRVKNRPWTWLYVRQSLPQSPATVFTLSPGATPELTLLRTDLRLEVIDFRYLVPLEADLNDHRHPACAIVTLVDDESLQFLAPLLGDSSLEGILQ